MKARAVLLAERERTLCARIEVERARLADLAQALRGPLRRAALFEQGARHVGARLRSVGRTPGLTIALLPFVLLIWRVRPALRVGMRIWVMVRLLQRWRLARRAGVPVHRALPLVSFARKWLLRWL